MKTDRESHISTLSPGRPPYFAVCVDRPVGSFNGGVMKKQRGFVDGLSMLILIVSYCFLKIGADEVFKPKEDGVHYTEKSVQQKDVEKSHD